MKFPPLLLGEAERTLELEETRTLLACAVMRPEIEDTAARPIAVIREYIESDGFRAVYDVTGVWDSGTGPSVIARFHGG